jgi:putative hemolysin
MLYLIILIALILINAYFSAAEIAFVSVHQYRLQQASDKGSKKASQLLQLLKNPEQYLSSIQVGITLIGIVEGIYGGELLQQYLGPLFIGWGLSAGLAHFLSLLISICGITYLSIVLGELLPKSIALSSPEKIAQSVLPSFRIFSIIAYPLVGLLTRSTHFLLKRFKLKDAEDNRTLTDDDLKGFLSQAYKQGTLMKTELELHQNIFRFYNETIRQVMTPASKTIVVQEDLPREDAAAQLQHSNHMFYPVLNVKGEVQGYLSAKEFFMYPEKSIVQLTLPACFILEEQTLPDLLERFKSYRYNFAIVVDRKGTFTGIITIHDIGTLLIGDFA